MIKSINPRYTKYQAMCKTDIKTETWRVHKTLTIKIMISTSIWGI